jgi:predicted glycoside hydrolase/deacetylase ChbG (UPF0249 family)
VPENAFSAPPPARRPFARLIVNADDFGLCARVDAGIVQAHRAGIVTAASLSPVGRAFGSAAAHCRALPALDVGVHLTLVAERPLRAGGSTLTGDDGRFPAGAGAFLRRWLAGGIRREDLRAEMAAQIERVLSHGVRVTHLDSHQHVHALPGIYDLTHELADRYRIPFVRAPFEELRGNLACAGRGLPRFLGAAALRACWAAARLARPVRQALRPPLFLGFLDGGRLDSRRLMRLVAALRPGRVYELMCHPGFAPQAEEIRGWNYRHEAELAALTDPAVRAALTARGVRLCGFAELARLP